MGKTKAGSTGRGAQLGALAGLERSQIPGADMVDGGQFDADKMYKDTKLCNVIFMQQLVRRLSAAHVSAADIAVNAFSPGLITQGSFFRCQKEENPILLGVCDLFARKIARVTETVECGGAVLANMAANPAYYTGTGGYWSNEVAGASGKREFVATPTSDESQDTFKGLRLFDTTARLVGVDPDAIDSTLRTLLLPRYVSNA